jgi:uncharacterized protein YvpB
MIEINATSPMRDLVHLLHPNQWGKYRVWVLALILSLLMAACQVKPQSTAASVITLPPPQVIIITGTPSPSPSPLPPTPTLASSLTPTLTITPTPTTAYPAEHYIEDIHGHRQYFPLGCEAAVAVDLALYRGVQISEYEFQTRLPQSDNPDFGYVGGLEGPWGQTPPYSYGVYAGPIADLLTEYGVPASGIKGYTLEEIKAQIGEDCPVIAWVIGNVVGGIPVEYTDSKGNKVIVAAYEHVVIVTGYSELEDTIRYMNNGRFYEVPTAVFENSWGVLGNMVVVLK